MFGNLETQGLLLLTWNKKLPANFLVLDKNTWNNLITYKLFTLDWKVCW